MLPPPDKPEDKEETEEDPEVDPEEELNYPTMIKPPKKETSLPSKDPK